MGWDWDALKISYIVFLILLVIFAILIIIAYTKDEYFRRVTTDSQDKLKIYPYYFNIFFCANIILYNLVRLIPVNFTILSSDEGENKITFLCRFQAISACFFEQELLFLMTNYSILNYLSVFKSDFYKRNLKKIYFTLISIGLLISTIITILISSEGTATDKDIVCSVHTRTLIKEYGDGILIGILMIVNLFCLISIIHNLVKIAKKYKNENEEKYKKSVDFIKRFIIETIFISSTFIFTFLVVIKTFERGSYKDIIYIILCQIVEIVFTINESLYRAFIRLITCNKYYKLEQKLEKFNDYDDDYEEKEDI